MFGQKQTQSHRWTVPSRLPYESSVSLKRLRPAEPHYETVAESIAFPSVPRHDHTIVACKESNVDLACAIYRM
jgi:hypothetical protein